MKKSTGFILLVIVSFAVLVAGTALHLLTGSVGIDDPSFFPVFLSMRMPRVVAGMLVGANLAIAGAVFQAITRNELASPYLLGVSQGAGLTVMTVLVLAPFLSAILPLLAMIGGVASFFIVYSIAWKRGEASAVRLVLAGVVYGAVVSTVQTILSLLIDDIQIVQNAIAWLTGSLVGSSWDQVKMILPWSIISFVAILAMSRHLDVMLLGDESAKTFGVPVNVLRFVFSLFAVLASASAVSVSGLVGFVGLIVPHFVRYFTGPNHRRLILGCAIAGPALMVAADAVARVVVSPLQLPVGAITGVMGGLFFLVLMKAGRRKYSLNGGRGD